MPSDEPSRPYNWRPKSLAKLENIIYIVCRTIVPDGTIA